MTGCFWSIRQGVQCTGNLQKCQLSVRLTSLNCNPNLMDRCSNLVSFCIGSDRICRGFAKKKKRKKKWILLLMQFSEYSNSFLELSMRISSLSPFLPLSLNGMILHLLKMPRKFRVISRTRGGNRMDVETLPWLVHEREKDLFYFSILCLLIQAE